MTSSDDVINEAARLVAAKIQAYKSTPITEPGYLEGLATSAAMSEFVEGLDDWWPSLIARSETSRGTFHLLRSCSARFLSRSEPMPSELKLWLVDYLTGHRSEPTTGRRGPNRTELENVLLLGLVREVASRTGLPVWPSNSQAQHHNALAIVALGSKLVKGAGLKTCFPVGEKALETRFNKARRWLAGNEIKNSSAKS